MAIKTYLGQTPINQVYLEQTLINKEYVGPTVPNILAPSDLASLTFWYDYSSYSGSIWYDKNSYNYDLNVSGNLASASLVDNGVAITGWGNVGWTGSVTESLLTPGNQEALHNTTYLTWIKPQEGYLYQPVGALANAQPVFQLSAVGASSLFSISKTLSGSGNGVVDIFPSGAIEVDTPFGEPTSSYIGADITSSLWTMVTVVIDTEGSQSRYKNLDLYDSSAVTPSSTFSTSSGAFAIATDFTTNGNVGWSGSIGAVMRFDEQLSFAKIQGIYNYYSQSAGYVV